MENKKKYEVYKHELNGKCYVGYTGKGFEVRLKEHIKSAKNGSQTDFHCAIRDFGIENIISEILFETNDKNEALRVESEMIIEHDTYHNGYNMKIRSGVSFDNSGYKWFSNPETGKMKLIGPGKIPPEGFIKGKLFGNKNFTNIGKKWYSNHVLKISSILDKNEINEDWVEGKFYGMTGRGVKWYSNHELKQTKPFRETDEIPSNWFLGFVYDKDSNPIDKGKWYSNDELKQSKIFKDDEIKPEGWEPGWKYGRKETKPTLGMKWYSNHILKKSGMFEPNDVPDDWVEGMFYGERPHRNAKWYSNPITQEETFFHEDEEIPNVWIIGRLNGGNGNLNSRWYSNDEIKESRMFKENEEIPPKWYLGAKYNGTTEGYEYYSNHETKQSILVKIDENPPEGDIWIKGRFYGPGSRIQKDSKWYSNHITRKSVLIKPEKLLDEPGWELGRFYQKDGSRYINKRKEKRKRKWFVNIETKESFLIPVDEIPPKHCVPGRMENGVVCLY